MKSSSWSDCNTALSAAAALPTADPELIAKFLTGYAQRIEANATPIVEAAHRQTNLPKSPRLLEVELPRTTGQLRQAAAAALEGSWSMPTIDTKLNIRSRLAPIGPICIFGPNNFPLAFNSISGGDFAAAIAAGNPVIAKSHPLQSDTTALLAAQAHAALADAGLPPTTVQLLYNLDPKDGLRLVADPRAGATAFTGSRASGLALKAAADAAGKLIYLEMSSLNPVVILPGSLRQRGEKIADEFTDSCLAASGQFCTSPGLVLLIDGPESTEFIAAIKSRFETRAPTPLLADSVATNLTSAINTLRQSGAQLTTGGQPIAGSPPRFANTLLRVTGDGFLADPHHLQTEAFGNCSLLVVARDASQANTILASLDGNLTGCIYSDTTGSDDFIYDPLAATLRPRVGRLLNDKMPTGVAVSPAMNHGGPFPSTGHPGFTAVGIPASLRRFARLECFDNVRPARLPPILQDANPHNRAWRLIDGNWTR